MLGIYACAHEDFPVMRFRYFVADREPHSQSEECKVWSIDCSESMPVRMKMDCLMVVFSVRVRNSMWACASTNSDIWGHALCLARFCPSASSNGKASLLETFCSTSSVSADSLGFLLFCDVQDFPSQQTRKRKTTWFYEMNFARLPSRRSLCCFSLSESTDWLIGLSHIHFFTDGIWVVWSIWVRVK